MLVEELFRLLRQSDRSGVARDGSLAVYPLALPSEGGSKVTRSLRRVDSAAVHRPAQPEKPLGCTGFDRPWPSEMDREGYCGIWGF